VFPLPPPSTPDIHTLSLHDALPICSATDNGQLVPYALGDIRSRCGRHNNAVDTEDQDGDFVLDSVAGVRTSESFVRYAFPIGDRSEEHTSELQSRFDLVCRLLLEKK